jgi:two-component system, OmpR family, phosphate regulon sensor histidine kinase PhoR
MVPFPEQENQLYDLKVNLLARTHFDQPNSVVVVEVSQDAFETLRQKFGKTDRMQEATGPWREKFESLRNQFFWDDGVYEALLKRILDEDPKRLLVTFFYSESLVILQDNPSLQRLARTPAVLWASQFDLDQKLLKPAPELTGLENYGFTNLNPDVDGVVRRAFLIQKNHMSLPFRALVEDQQSVKTGMPLTDPFLIRYTGTPGHIPSCSVLDLFDEGESRCGSLKDRFVILSPTGNIVAGASLYRTPVGYMSRGEALANILLTAKRSEPVRPVSLYLLFFAVLGHCLVLSRIVLHSGGRRQLTTAVFLLAGEAAVSLIGMRLFSLHIPLVPFVIATATTYFAFLWLKFAQQEAKRWQAEKKTQYLRELDELKSNFISLMSHDLKTPIAKVQALAERLTREAKGLTEEQREILGSIQRSNEELGHYILSILNFQRIESQEIKLNRKSHDINLLIEEVVQRLSTLSQDRGVPVTLELEPMFPVELDEQLIKQVLSNLIDNAIKYNKPGTKVTVRSTDLEDYVEVSVEDDGIGIDPEQKDRLFKKFSRSEKGTSERVKGTGLGLYLAKYFIELHGGDIDVESEPGKGTTFRFRLPVGD